MKHDWYLWKMSQTDARFQFLPLSDLPEAGFQSVYGVSEVDAERMMEERSYRGFVGVVWSPALWVDCDTDEQAKHTQSVLEGLGLRFERWATGNRGLHFSIPRKAFPSASLPSLDRHWVENLLDCDLSLYTRLHLLRRPGAIHAKTGKKKTLLQAHSGDVLDLRGATLPRPSPSRLQMVVRGTQTSVFEDALLMNMTLPVQAGMGQRHAHFVEMAKRLSKLGMSYDFAKTWIEEAGKLSDPLPDSEVISILDWAYSRGKVA